MRPRKLPLSRVTQWEALRHRHRMMVVAAEEEPVAVVAAGRTENDVAHLRRAKRLVKLYGAKRDRQQSRKRHRKVDC